MEVGALYKITGAGRMESGALKINAFSAVRVSAPPAAEPIDVGAGIGGGRGVGAGRSGDPSDRLPPPRPSR
jgi:hypothetical protein